MRVKWMRAAVAAVCLAAVSCAALESLATPIDHAKEVAAESRDLVRQVRELEDQAAALEARRDALTTRVALGEITEAEAADERDLIEAALRANQAERASAAAELASGLADVDRTLTEIGDDVGEVQSLAQRLLEALQRGDVITALTLLAMLIFSLRRMGQRIGVVEETATEADDRARAASSTALEAKAVAEHNIKPLGDPGGDI